MKNMSSVCTTTVNSWDVRFMGLARHVASWSKDPSTKVGAVLVDPLNRIVSLGFNGLPRGVADDARLDDRPTKYEMIVHAEANALLFAGAPARGCTAYVWPLPPCSRCASLLIQAGVARVVAPPLPDERWVGSCQLAAEMFAESGVDTQQLYCEEIL